MKRLVLLLATLLLLPLSATAKHQCQYIGSWFGYNSVEEISWTSQANGKSASNGTMLLELPGFDVTFGGNFDVANSTGNIKGVWERIGDNTFSYAGMSIATDMDGKALYVLRVEGDVTVMGDCDVLYVDNTRVSIYIVDALTDPIPIWVRDPDIGPLDYDPHYGFRMELDNP